MRLSVPGNHTPSLRSGSTQMRIRTSTLILLAGYANCTTRECRGKWQLHDPDRAFAWALTVWGSKLE
eukprot:2231839-Rhodomonas_salina.1